MARLTKTFVNVNKVTVKDGISYAEDTLKQYVADTRPLPKGPSDPTAMPGDGLSWLFDNPVMTMLQKLNPLSILTEAATEAFGDDLKVPDIWPLVSAFTDAIPNLLSTEFANVMRLVEDFGSKFEQFVKDPSSAGQLAKDLLGDVLWTLIDAITAVIDAVMEILSGVISAGINIVSQTWKIPFVTSIYEWLTGQVCSSLEDRFCTR
jgi:hypothetical protein